MSTDRGNDDQRRRPGTPGRIPALNDDLGRPRTDSGRLVLIAAFAVAAGQIESVVTVLLRRAADLIPCPADLSAVNIDTFPGWIVAVEQTREVAAVVMLLCLGALAGRNARERFGATFLAGGIWVLARYVGLRWMMDWPATLGAVDLVWLMPEPWYIEVWVALLAGVGMAVLGGLCFKMGRTTRG